MGHTTSAGGFERAAARRRRGGGGAGGWKQRVIAGAELRVRAPTLDADLKDNGCLAVAEKGYKEDIRKRPGTRKMG